MIGVGVVFDTPEAGGGGDGDGCFFSGGEGCVREDGDGERAGRGMSWCCFFETPDVAVAGFFLRGKGRFEEDGVGEREGEGMRGCCFLETPDVAGARGVERTEDKERRGVPNTEEDFGVPPTPAERGTGTATGGRAAAAVREAVRVRRATGVQACTG
jgi:hypothetical protein